MFQKLRSAVKIRTAVVILVIHAGLVLAILGLARQSAMVGWDANLNLMMVGTLCLYGGFLLAVLFVLVPLLPWIRRAKRVEHWSERLMRDLPLLIENLPKIVAAFQAIMAIWNDSRSRSAPTPAHPRRAPKPDSPA
jgi:hypothetical protein